MRKRSLKERVLQVLRLAKHPDIASRHYDNILSIPSSTALSYGQEPNLSHQCLVSTTREVGRLRATLAHRRQVSGTLYDDLVPTVELHCQAFANITSKLDEIVEKADAERRARQLR
jgi:hypothetical protein